MNSDEKNKYYLKTLGNAFEVMDILSNRLEPMSISDLDKELKIGKSKIHRILDTLKYWDYVDQDVHSRKYLLGYKVLVLAMNKLKSMDIVDVVIPHLEELVTEFGETVHLGVLDQGEVLYLAKKQGIHAIGIISKVGQKLPAHCTGLGKALLAHLKERELDEILNNVGMPKMAKNTITDKDELKRELVDIRERGFAVENEEISEGLCFSCGWQ